MSDDRFKNIPEQEVVCEGWRDHFSKYAAQARATSWGMLENERRILGLCVMLDEALEDLAGLEDKQAEIEELQRQLKGKQLENGRLKKEIAKLKGEGE